MPVKLRAAKERHPSFSTEVLALFTELERMRQRGQKFEDRAHELARLLGLVPEWWTGNHVNDRSAEPYHPPGSGYVARADWFRCRETRIALLAAASQTDDKRTSR